MRSRNAITVGVLALGAVAGTGLAAQADNAEPAAKPANAEQAAVAGYQIVKLPNANVPAFTRRYVYCPAGKHVVGGGGEAQGNGAILVGSFPTDDGRGWIALGRQNGYNTVGISVYAICANAG
ncbi:MAG: hypothetical protein JWO67_3656 [Streptosporangiaceae bacterium]|jgi:hypothetical protein|nr:hypothetical protein [Streptosporangiaceae bacterium]